MNTSNHSMIRAARGLGWALAIGAGALFASGAASAQSVSDFYKRGGLRIVVGSGAGGGYDGYSRVLQRHYGRHLPGNPNVVVQNMPGASGMLATNWAFNSAPRDGSRILATYSTMMGAHLLGNDAAKFDVRKFSMIGSIAKTQLLCVTWHTSPHKDIRQLIGKPITVSATGRTGTSATMPLVLNQLMGTQFKVIMGYSTTGSRLALERGEVDGICGLGLSTLRASNPEWFINKKVNILLQLGLTNLDEIKDVPNPINMVDAAAREVLEFGAILQEMGRPFVAPPEIPADRLAALQAGFDATMKDKAFAGELDKLKLELQPLTGKEMEQLVAKLYAFKPEVVRRASEIQGFAASAKVDACRDVAKDTKQCEAAKKKKSKKKDG